MTTVSLRLAAFDLALAALLRASAERRDPLVRKLGTLLSRIERGHVNRADLEALVARAAAGEPLVSLRGPS